MRFSNILPLALGASAFLVPADVKEDVDIVDKIPASATAQIIQLECDGGCPVGIAKDSDEGAPYEWTKFQPSKLVADIKVEKNIVYFNGRPIWPNAGPQPLAMRQKADSEVQGAFSGLMPVSSSMEYREAEIWVDPIQHLTIHPIDIEILALADQVVHVQNVEVRVAETNGGIALLPSRIRPYRPSPFTDKCTNVWCRVRGTIAKKLSELHQAASQKIKGWRGCGGKKVDTIKGLPIKGGPAKFGPGSTLDPNRPHGGHMHHGHHGHRHGSVRNFVIHIFETFIFPTIFGLSVGLIGGTFVWLLIHAVRRITSRPQADYIIVEQIDAEEGVAGPPKYEEAVYREPQQETEDEKKELLQ